MKILLIEDNPGDARIVQEMLAEVEKSVDLTVASTLTEGAHEEKKHGYDLVLLDLGMPESQGIKTLVDFRQAMQGNSPIVVLTGLDDKEMSLAAIQQGAQDYLVKGEVSAAQLARCLRHAMERNRLMHDLQEAHHRLEELVDEQARSLEEAHKELKISENKYRTLFESAGDAIYVHDLEGNIIDVNEAACKSMGYSRNELLEMQRIDLISEEFRESFAKRAVQIAKCGQGRFECAHRRKDGSEFPVECLAKKLEYNGETAIVTIVRDISERKKSEEAERKSRELLLEAERMAHAGAWEWDILRDEWHFSENWSKLHATDFSSLSMQELLDIAHPDDIPAIQKAFDRTIQEGVPYDIEHRIVRQGTGEVRIIQAYGKAIKDDSGKVVKVIGTSQDITERKQTEEALQRSEDILNRSQTIARVGGWEMDLATNQQEWTEETYRIHEVPADFSPNLEKGLGFFHGENREAIDEAVQRCAEQGKPYDLELKMLTARGREIWVKCVGQAVVAGGKPVRLIGTIQDITERKRAELEATRSEKRWHRLMQALPVGCVVHDLDSTIVSSNQAARDVLGFSEKQMQGKTAIDPAWSFVRPDGSPMPVEEYPIKKVMESGRPLKDYLLGVNRPDMDEPVWVLVNADPVFNADQQMEEIIVTSLDVTERIQAEKALRESESLFRKVFEILPVGLWIADKDGRLMTGNPAGVAIWGAEPSVGQEEYGMFKARRLPSGEEVEPDDWALVHTVREGKTIRDELLEIDAFDGQKRTILNSTAPVLDDEGNVVAAIVVNQDISDLKRHEKMIQQQADRSSLLNQITLATSERQDLDSIFQVVLSSLEESLDIDISAILFFDPEQHLLSVEAVGPGRNAARKALSKTMNFSLDLESVHNGTPATIEKLRTLCEQPLREAMRQAGFSAVQTVPLVAESELVGFLVVATTNGGFVPVDLEFLTQLANHLALAIREKKVFHELQGAYRQLQKSQETTLKQERIKALGQMASGIVHDINNAMSPIVGYTDLLLERTWEDDTVTKYLKHIRTAAHDVIHIISQMREFYRNREERETQLPLDLNKVVDQVKEMTRPRWRDIPHEQGRLIVFDKDLQEDLPLVPGVESEVREALTNLIFNAVDALGKEGVVLVRTWQEGDNVVLSVRDNGAGMDKAIQKQCLEPFFTTKGDKGTGLGLAMVYGIMRRHGGRLEIKSEEGKGTEVRLRFKTNDIGIVAEDPLEPTGPLPQLKILCIDDEASIRKLLDDMLGMDGHEVVVAENGAEGLDVFSQARKGGEPFDVVVTDLGMPFMDGHEVVEHIKKESPATPVILLTGWGSRMRQDKPALNNVSVVLSKPPVLQSLRRALHHVLDNPTSVEGFDEKILQHGAEKEGQ